MQQILKTLFEAIPALTPKLKDAARVILDNPNLVATTSMRALAARAGVTPPTMIRLATTLGFENYDSFRRVFQASINEQNFEDRANWLQTASAADGVTRIVHEIAESGVANLKQFFQELDLDAISRAADTIIAAPNVYLVAAGGIHWIASYLHYVCKMAIPQMHLLTNRGNGLVEELIPVKEGDVVLAMAYHPYARHGIEAVEFSLARGARMIYLTDSLAAPLASKADILILQKTESPQFFPSMVAVMAAAETLISVIVSRGGDDAMRSIADYSEIRAKGDFYLG